MATLDSVLCGLEILAGYDTVASIEADGDVIFCSGPPPTNMAAPDAKRLTDLGWFHNGYGWRKFT